MGRGCCGSRSVSPKDTPFLRITLATLDFSDTNPKPKPKLCRERTTQRQQRRMQTNNNSYFIILLIDGIGRGHFSPPPTSSYKLLKFRRSFFPFLNIFAESDYFHSSRGFHRTIAVSPVTSATEWQNNERQLLRMPI